MRTTRSVFVTLTLVASACSEDASNARDQSGAPNVILICMDTVRADRLGCYGYGRRPTTPCLDELASGATVFTDASATAGWTKPSVPSFLTGTYPMQHGVYEGSAHDSAGQVTDLLPQDAITITEVFKQHMYATAAFVHNAQLKRGNGFEQGFDDYVDETGDARDIRWRAEDWLEEHVDLKRAAEQPFFLYLHFLDAHWPHDVPDEYAAKFAKPEEIAMFRGGGASALRDAINDGTRKLSSAELDALGALYDGSLRSIDDELAKLFLFLERRGAWEDTIVCVIADHGEEFMEHGRIGHGHGLYENLLRVPWILRVPGRAARRSATPVSLIDLFATLSSAAGIAAPASAGLDRLREPDAARPILAEHKEPSSYQQSLRASEHKLVRRVTMLAKERAVEESAPTPSLGSRWEVELDATALGAPRARRVRPRTEAASEPLEVKGPVESFSGNRLKVASWIIEIDAQTDFYGALPAQGSGRDALVHGAEVKVQCALDGDRMRARRIKLYPSDESDELQIRGTLTALEGSTEAGRIALCGVWIDVDEHTRWELTESPKSRGRLTRDDVLAFTLAGDEGGARADMRVTTQRFALSEDPGEQSAFAPQPASDSAHLAALDTLARTLAARRVWAAGDRAVLDARALDQLRALGYVR